MVASGKAISAEQGDHGVLPGRHLRRVEGIPVESQNLHHSDRRIDDPVLSDSSTSIERTLCQQIATSVRGTQHFDQKVRWAFDAADYQVGIAVRQQDDNDIWLHWVSALEKHVERSS